jgi:hypothetical protein
MNALMPRAAQLRSRRWWVLVGALAAATFIAALGSYAVALTDLMISPMLLTPGVGTAVLVRWGRSLWPGFVVGDLAGQLVMRDRTWTLVVLTVAIHLAIVLLGTTWLQRSRPGVGSLPDVLRFAGIATVLSSIAATFSVLAVMAIASLQCPVNVLGQRQTVQT